MKKIIFTLGALGSGLVLAAEDHSQHFGHEMPVVAPVATPSGPAVEEPGLPAPTPAELAAAFPDIGGRHMQDHMGSSRYWYLQADRLEAQRADNETAAVWEGRIGWGGDSDRLWLESSGERAHGQSDFLETSLWWSHAVARWWDTTLGVRQDGGEQASRTWAAIGIKGLAPYFFETDVTAFVGESGRTALRLGAEYEARLSNRLILQPAVEINLHGKDDPASGIGRGLSDAELGLRLRYEIRRTIAPYVGMEWSRTYGDTADFARAGGASTSDARGVAGIRFWY